MINRKDLKVGYYCRSKEGFIAKLIDYSFNKNYNAKLLTFDSFIEYGKNVLLDEEVEKYITKCGITISEVVEPGDIAYMFAGFSIFKKLTQNDIIEIKLHNYIVITIMSEQVFNILGYKNISI